MRSLDQLSSRIVARNGCSLQKFGVLIEILALNVRDMNLKWTQEGLHPPTNGASSKTSASASEMVFISFGIGLGITVAFLF